MSEKKNVDDKLSDFLEIDNVFLPIEGEIVNDTITPVSNATNEDYEYARQNLKNIIAKGQDAIEGIMILAKEGESPRAYEVVGQLMKNLVDANKDLLELQKKVNEIENGRNSGNKTTNNITNNALFVGTAKELQSILKDMRNKEE